MHEPYEEDDDEDPEYPEDKYKHYFKFDPAAWVIEKFFKINETQKT